jgi:hypothetical protein
MKFHRNDPDFEGSVTFLIRELPFRIICDPPSDTLSAMHADIHWKIMKSLNLHGTFRVLPVHIATKIESIFGIDMKIDSGKSNWQTCEEYHTFMIPKSILETLNKQ